MTRILVPTCIPGVDNTNNDNNNDQTKLGGGWGYRFTAHCKW